MTSVPTRSETPPNAAAPLHAATHFTTGPPHVRNALDVSRAMMCVLIAAAPCIAMALYNTGYQAARAFEAAGVAPAGWRATALGVLAAGLAPTHPWSASVFGALYFVPLLATAAAAGWTVEQLFARLRRRTPDHVALPVIVTLFVLCLPPTLPPWQAAFGCAVGMALGKEIFGGFGRNFVNPALTGLAFLYFAYPGAVTGDAVWFVAPPGLASASFDGWSAATPLAAASRGGLGALREAGLAWQTVAIGRLPGAMGGTSALASAIGLGILLYTGVASWRIVAGGVAGLVAGALLVQLLAPSQPMADLPWYWHLVAGSVAFGLVFFATDPVTAAVTNPGRWIYGFGIGVAVVVIRVANPAYREGVLLAILLGNVSAPLIDQMVARVQMRPRSRSADVGS